MNYQMETLVACTFLYVLIFSSPDMNLFDPFFAGVTMLSAMETAVKCEVDLPLNLKTHVSTDLLFFRVAEDTEALLFSRLLMHSYIG